MDVIDSYKDVPLSFESNHGQAHPKIKFLAHRREYSVFLTPEEIFFVLSDPNVKELSSRYSNKWNPKIKLIKMSFIGSNTNSYIEGIDKYPLPITHLIGEELKHLHSETSIYAKVKYNNIYPGIDLIYYGNGSELEYDFIISPGSSPEAIMINFEGVDYIELDCNGNLILKFEEGFLTFCKPCAYQIRKDVRFEIPCQYTLRDCHNVRLEISDYDPEYEIIIDPLIYYYTFHANIYLKPYKCIASDSIDSLCIRELSS